MTSRIARLLVLGGLCAATGCASGVRRPRLVPGSNITLPPKTDFIRELLLACEESARTAQLGERAHCLVNGPRETPTVPVAPR